MLVPRAAHGGVERYYARRLAVVVVAEVAHAVRRAADRLAVDEAEVLADALGAGVSEARVTEQTPRPVVVYLNRALLVRPAKPGNQTN